MKGIGISVTLVLAIINGLGLNLVLAEEDASTEGGTEPTTTTEPEATAGCNPPDIRFTRPRRLPTTTTSSPMLTFETTQVYLPEDFTTADLEFINHNKQGSEFVDDNTGGGDDGLNGNSRNTRFVNFSPYTWNDEKKNFESIRENPYGGNGGSGGASGGSNVGNGRERAPTDGEPSKRNKRDIIYITTTSKSGRRILKRSLSKSDNEFERIYIQSTDLVSSLQLLDDKKNQISLNGRRHDGNGGGLLEGDNEGFTDARGGLSNASDFIHSSRHNIQNVNNRRGDSAKLDSADPPDESNQDQAAADETSDDSATHRSGNHTRVKRKSGKTTGALSRPKGDSGSSSSKSTSRKTQAGYDEDTGEYRLPHPDGDREESSKEEGSEESSEQNVFREVTEVRFPSEVGPLGDRRLCKIKCVKGKWVGPLCASLDDEEGGNYKFLPLYKSCHVNRVPPHLLLSYRNISVNVGWDLPHGHSLQARCSDLGMYKLLGESRVLCSNGLWAPRMPSCVPTTLLTNYSDDSPPSIRIKVGVGSGSFEPSGVLAVLPSSTIHLDCMYPRKKGTPEWTWTGWFRQYITGWSTIAEEKATRYRLSIKDIQQQDSGTYTCASPRGLTNSIVLVVAVSVCPQLTDTPNPLQLRLEGNKLGQRALYRCPTGYTLEGTANSTCLASGNWSSPAPNCHPVQCPPLYLDESHLSLVELNSSAWGRAVFKCSWGYRLNGPSSLECEPTGIWSGPVPRCRAIQCPQPLVPINGRIDGTSGSNSQRRYAVGALVTFSCTEGHLLVGEASIVCTESGFWSHPPPFCKAQCPYPGDPPNGLIAPLKFHYDPGDSLTVQCRPGFVEYNTSGPLERPHCLADGNWSGPVSQCISTSNPQ